MIRRLWIVVAVGVACACGDAFAPGHSRAALNLVPTFSENVYELLTGDLDQLHIRISHIPGAAVVLDTTVKVDTAGNVDLDLAVTLSAETDSFTVLLEGIRSSDNTVLYSGFDTVVVAAGSVTPPGDTIAVNYVGPCAASAGCTVTVAPQDSSLTQGDSLLMRVTVDSSGQTIPGVPVSVTNVTPALVAVSPTRYVRALPGPGGPARIAVAIHGAAVDTLRLTVAASGFPVIGLSAKSIAFSGTQGGSDPAAQTVNITNTGIGSLTGLAQSITYVTGTPGWLAAGVSPTTAPATLTLTPTLGSLTPGSYHGRVTVSSSVPGVASDTVGVTFTVNAGAPAVVIVTPGYAALRLTSPGNTAQLADTVKDGLGNLLSPSAATWTSRSPGVATVSPTTGLVTATGRGIATIVASAGAGVADSILVAVGDTTGHGDMLIFALTNGRAFGQRKVNQTAQVDFVASHAAVPADSLASYTIHYVWNQTVLRFDSVKAGTFTGAPTVNTDSTGNGVLIFADINVNGVGGAPVLLHAYFTAIAAGSDAHSVQVTELSGSAPIYVNFYQLVQYLAVSGNAAISP